jgi:hypothetical protein
VQTASAGLQALQAENFFAKVALSVQMTAFWDIASLSNKQTFQGGDEQP